MKFEINGCLAAVGTVPGRGWLRWALCVLLAAVFPAAADVLYENVAERADPERFAQSGFEFGEEIILAGPGTHTVTNFQYEFFGYGSDFTSNLVQVALRFYRNDGPLGVPGTLLFDSGFYPIPATPASGSVIAYAGLNVAVPRNFTWSIEFQGLTSGGAGLQAGGLDLYRLPTVGQTYDDYWERSGSGGTWALRTPDPGQPAINFGCRVDGDYAGAPVIIRQPQDQVGRLGHGAEFRVEAIGTQPLSYQWQRGSTNLPGATNAILTLPDLAFTDGVAYHAIVANSLGSVTSAPARLVVNLPLLYDNTTQRADPPRFAEAGFEFGEEIILAGNGTAYLVTNFLYEFFGYGVDFTNGSVSVALRFYANDGPAGVPGTLIFDSGYSPIPATGPAGSVISYIGLNVSVPRSFTWTVEFQGLTSGGAGLQGAGLDLYGVPAIGQTYDDYWERSGAGGTWQLRVPGPGQPAINFGCQVAGLYSGAPFLTQLPKDQDVFLGRTAVFTAFALGTPPLSYQWRKGGNSLAGETNNFLVLPAVAYSDAGAYSVCVSNAFGVATSPNAILTVLAPDVQPPVAVCPANLTLAAAAGACTNTVSFTATATDNYPGATIACTPASGSAFAKGTNTVTCVATDTYGNTNACTFTVTVEDQESPVLGACPAAVTVGTSAGTCASNVTYAVPSATDNCTPAPAVACTPASGSSFAKGTNTVTCVATDGSGNTSTCTFKIIVQDQWNPVLGVVPSAVTVGTSAGSCASNVTYTVPSATDNCTPAPTVACSPASGSSFSKGTTVVTCVATDGSGNTHTRSFTVTVQDLQPPTLTCPGNLTVGTSNVTYVVPGATDNCTPAPTVACVPASGSVFPPGPTTVVCTATDGSGNTNACSFVVTVSSTPPSGLAALVRLGFNENTGIFAANSGTLGGLFTLSVPVPIWTTNAPPNLGTAIDFGTTTGNYGVDSPGVLSGLGNLPRFTITGWLNNRSTTTGSGGNRVVRHYVSGGHGIDLVYRNDGSLDLGVNAFANSLARSSGSRIPTSATASPANWRFFAVTYDSTLAKDNVRYYFGSPTVNATFDRAATLAAGPVGPNIGILTVGAVNPPARPTATDRMFRGLIDNVAIFDSVLSAADILTIQRERPTISIAAVDATASEPGTDTGLFRITRVGPTDASLTVSLLWDGTAVNGVDYQARSNTVVMPAGAASVDITVVPIDDTVYDPEIVTLTLLPSAAYGIGVPSTASITLLDNDVQTYPLPLVRLRLNEGTGTTTVNAGSLGGSFTRTTAVPAWTTNRPPVVGGASAADFGTTVGNYGIDSAGVLDGLGNLPAFTLAGWLNNRSTTIGSGGNRVIRNYVSGGHGIDLVYRNDGSLDLGVNAFPNSTARSSASRIPASATADVGNWRFFAVTYDSTLASGQVRFFFGTAAVDAALDVTRTYAAGSVGTNVGALTIGHVNVPARAGALDRMFRGLIDEVAIFGAVLTPPEIISLQRGTAPLPRLQPDGTIQLLHPVDSLSLAVQDGMARLLWPTETGGLYQVEFLDALDGAPWQILMPECPGTGGPVLLEDPVKDSLQRFYRVWRQGAP